MLRADRPRPLRRRAAVALLAVLARGAACAPRSALPMPAGPPLVRAVETVGMTVAAMDRSVDFYSQVLGFRLISDAEVEGTDVERLQEHLNNVADAHLRITALRAAAGPGIELLEYLAPRDGKPAPADIAAAVTRLRAARTPFVSPGAVVRADDALGFRAGTMVRDPDGHARRVLGH